LFIAADNSGIMQFTQEQIVKLAPDDASVKAGKALATVSKWVVKSVHERALWGDCQGSGKTPYKTIVDLANLAFKCSCPSRKFPCKHGLGLLFLYSSNSSSFSTEINIAPHVEEWLEKRATKAESKSSADKAPDEQAQLKRAELREKKVNAGVEELRLWLRDVVRTGIMNVPQNPYQFNQNITARMVDSQAGGLANQLRKINRINFYSEGWQKHLIKQLSKTYLLTESYLNLESLTDELKQEVRAQIGWTTPKEELLSLEGIKDEWLVLAITLEEEANLKTEKAWLYGSSSKRCALILSFYAGNQLPATRLIEGGTVNAELVYYPSATPLRALLKDHLEARSSFTDPEVANDIMSLHENVTVWLSENPFAEQLPFILNQVKVIFIQDQWFLADASHKSVPLKNTEDECWKMLAISKAREFQCFGTYENELFNIHSVWTAQNFYSIL
jgi:hypothetical protein